MPSERAAGQTSSLYINRVHHINRQTNKTRERDCCAFGNLGRMNDGLVRVCVRLYHASSSENSVLGSAALGAGDLAGVRRGFLLGLFTNPKR